MNINYLLIINDDVTEDRSDIINSFFKKKDIVLDSVKLYKCYRINGPLVNTFVTEEAAKHGIYHVFKDDVSYRDYMRFRSLRGVFYEYAFKYPIKFIWLDMCNSLLNTPTIKQISSFDRINETRTYELDDLDLVYSISHEMITFYEKYEKIRSEMNKDIMYTIIRDPYSSITLVSDSFESDDIIVSGNLY
jgi:hypothetical protein